MIHKSNILHLTLFLLTIASTFFVGLGDGLSGAFWYSGGLMSILLAHEMGHFLMARRYGVPVSLPFFIPMPLPPFGTMGAVIKMKGMMPNRKALFDVGAAGPFAGLTLIIPAIFFGLKMSPVVEKTADHPDWITLGDSLLFTLLSKIAVGTIPESSDILLHPLAFAGWVGLLVTAINLLPAGQLDGGHVLYAIMGRKSRFAALFFYAAFVIIFLFFYAGWGLLIILLAIFRNHPPTWNDAEPIGRERRILGGLTLLLFVLSFTPVPFGFAKGLIPLILEGF